MYLHQEVTHKIIAAAIEVHKNLGPGLLEVIYRLCLGLDFLIEDKIILELKSVETILPVHEAQLLTYSSSFGHTAWTPY